MQMKLSEPGSARRRGRPKVTEDVELVTRIARTAYGILCARGYVGMNMDEVASSCGVSKKTLYRLFPSKLELFRVITDAHRDAMIDLSEDFDDLPLADALVKIFRMDIAASEDEDRCAFMRVVLIEAMQVPELHEIVHEHGRDRTFHLLAGWLERQRARGRIAAVDSHHLTKMIIDIAFGAILHPAPDGWLSSADRATYLQRCFEVLVAGVAPRPRSAVSGPSPAQ